MIEMILSLLKIAHTSYWWMALNSVFSDLPRLHLSVEVEVLRMVCNNSIIKRRKLFINIPPQEETYSTKCRTFEYTRKWNTQTTHDESGPPERFIVLLKGCNNGVFNLQTSPANTHFFKDVFWHLFNALTLLLMLLLLLIWLRLLF